MENKKDFVGLSDKALGIEDAINKSAEKEINEIKDLIDDEKMTESRTIMRLHKLKTEIEHFEKRNNEIRDEISKLSNKLERKIQITVFKKESHIVTVHYSPAKNEYYTNSSLMDDVSGSTIEEFKSNMQKRIKEDENYQDLEFIES